MCPSEMAPYCNDNVYIDRHIIVCYPVFNLCVVEVGNRTLRSCQLLWPTGVETGAYVIFWRTRGAHKSVEGSLILSDI